MPELITNSALMIFILTLLASSILGSVSSKIPNFIYSNCQEQNSYISGSAFEVNLNDTLFDHLRPKASKVKFSNFTVGSGADRVNALFYCVGDVDAQTCQSCVDAAANKITDVCKSSKEGIVWFEECTLRYANRTIFSIDEERHYHLYYNHTGIVNEFRLDKYKAAFDNATDDLVTRAAYGKGNLSGFATKEVKLSSSEVIRGLAQCTPDIVGPGCYKCLKTALRLRDTWAHTMVFLPSCFFRYDLYESVASASSSLSPRPREFSAFYIALMVVLPIVFIVVAVIGCRRLWKRCSRDDPPVVRPPNEGRVQGLTRYTFLEVRTMTNGFGKEIGKGGFGVVFHGRLLDGSREVAVKMLHESDAPMQFSNEIDVFGKISHKNLVSLLGYCEDGTRLALIYEYMDNRDLRALLSENAGSLSWTDRLNIAIDTAEGLHYLHKHCTVRIVHRDVKPANILLNRSLQAKVADFGFSKIFPEKDVTTLKTRVVSSPGYTAPEYSTTGLLNEKVDVYSFGVVLLELITGNEATNLVKWFVNLFNKGDVETILDSRMTRANNPTMQRPDCRSVWEATELARACVEEDETERPDMWKIVVKLKECLDMEVRKNSGNSGSGSRSMEMSPVVSRSITMGPEGTTSQDSPRYISKTCQEKKSYISGSAFETNLNDTLLNELLSKASTVKFSNFTKGIGEDQVYALYYCRGDVDVQTCQNCAEAATRKITDVCKFCKEGMVWFEECTLRYANRNIFSISEESPYYL
ncbi:hypothetical protein RND81_11G043500 [Saponaria officinalis]|uniref:non-specific serine/threonine protein kinase n=1 Tax=Saponaria officinalis TaxID=3572 RepID=A0AAW1HI81_SAPOF